MIYFTSDTHFGHANIIKYCGRTQFMSPVERVEFAKLNTFSKKALRDFVISDETVERMDAYMLEQINAVVKEDDTLYHDGDAFWRNNAKSIRDKIKCQDMHLIWGNHDKPEIADLFSSNHQILELAIEGQEIVLCHYPMRAWNRSHHGAWNLFGHVHGMLDYQKLENALDVGVDSHNFKPLSFEQLKRHFNDAPTIH